MIAPVRLIDLLAASRLEAAKRAIIASLGNLLPGVKVVGHPGKLDVNDVLAKAIVAAPGIALGWSRVRATRDIGGTTTQPIDWTAYIVVEDFIDATGSKPRKVEREIVGHAIGSQILRILADPDAASWGLTGLDVVATEPPPQFAPVMTMITAEQGTALYAATWTQALVLEGASFFDGPTPAAAPDPDGDVLDFDLAPGDLPIEIQALIGRGGA